MNALRLATVALLGALDAVVRADLSKQIPLVP